MDNSFSPWLRQSSWITPLGFCSVVSRRNSLWGRDNNQKESVSYGAGWDCTSASPMITLLQHWSQKTYCYFSLYLLIKSESVSSVVECLQSLFFLQFSYNRNYWLIINLVINHLLNNCTLMFHVWLSIATVLWPRISTSSQQRCLLVLNVFVSHYGLLWGCGEVWGQMLSLVPCL